MAGRSGGELDLQGATIQVGKALQDPVRGMTALRRVGVNFSDSQQTLIQRLVDTGHTLEAQRIILAELHKEFGGSAIAAGDTLPGALNKLNNAFDEAMGAMVATAAPALTRIIGGLTQFSEFLQGVFAHKKLSVRLDLLWEGVQSVASDLWDAFLQAWNGEQGSGAKPIMVNGRNIAFEGTPPTEGFRKKLTDAFEAVDWNTVGQKIADGIGNAITTALANINWGAVASVGMALLIAGWQAQIPLLEGIFIGIPVFLVQALIEGFSRANSRLNEAIVGFLGGIDWGGLVGGIAAGLLGAGELMLGAGQQMVSLFLQPWQLLPQLLGAVGGRVIGFIGGMISGAMSRLSGWAGSAAGAARNVANGIINAFTSLAGRVGGFVADMVSGALGKLRGFVGSAGSAAQSIVNNIVNAFSGIAGKIGGKLSTIGGTIHNALSSVANMAFGWASGLGHRITEGIVSGVSGVASAVQNAVEDGVRSGLDAVNPFSPIEEGAARLIGEPIVIGAVRGVAGLASALQRAVEQGVVGGVGTVDGGTTNNKTVNVGQVILPTVTTGGDLVRQLDALVARPG
jgi:phage-related protein